MQVEGQPPFDKGTGGLMVWRYVTPGYFATLGIPILHGRAFRERRSRVRRNSSMILSESFARRLFPNGDAVGKRIKTDGPGYRVVGVAADVRNLGPLQARRTRVLHAAQEHHRCIFHVQEPPTGWRQAKLAIRTSVNPKVMADWLKREFAALDPALPVKLGSMQDRVGKMTGPAALQRISAEPVRWDGRVAGGHRTVWRDGVSGGTANAGNRRADGSGATPGAITKLVLSRAAAWTLAGVLLGLAGALFAARAFRRCCFRCRRAIPGRWPWWCPRCG